MGATARQCRLHRHHRLRRGEFLITANALAELLDPDLDGIDSETALEAFEAHEKDIHRIALREFVKRLGGEPPILLTSADLDA
jgi:hypothetical protein